MIIALVINPVLGRLFAFASAADVEADRVGEEEAIFKTISVIEGVGVTILLDPVGVGVKVGVGELVGLALANSTVFA